MQQVGGQVAVLGDPGQHVLGGEPQIVRTAYGAELLPGHRGGDRRHGPGRASSRARSCCGPRGSGCSRRRSGPRAARPTWWRRRSPGTPGQRGVQLLDVGPDVPAPAGRDGGVHLDALAARGLRRSAAARPRPSAAATSSAARALSTMVMPAPGIEVDHHPVGQRLARPRLGVRQVDHPVAAGRGAADPPLRHVQLQGREIGQPDQRRPARRRPRSRSARRWCRRDRGGPRPGCPAGRSSRRSCGLADAVGEAQPGERPVARRTAASSSAIGSSSRSPRPWCSRWPGRAPCPGSSG